jgi:hypothetical protein
MCPNNFDCQNYDDWTILVIKNITIESIFGHYMFKGQTWWFFYFFGIHLDRQNWCVQAHIDMTNDTKWACHVI